MLMPLKSTRRHLEGAIRGRVIGRHGWTWKTPQIACNPFRLAWVQNPNAGMDFRRVRQAGGVKGVSGRKQGSARLSRQSMTVGGR